jgi:hypothetical protein
MNNMICEGADMNNDFSPLEDQIRDCFGRVVYTHKTHEKMADNCNKRLTKFKVSQIIISSITASGAFSVLFIDQSWLKILTALVSLVSLILTGYMKGFDPGGTAQKHRDAAANIWPIRESYQSLLTDIRMKTINDAEAAARRDELQERLSAIYKGAPHTNSTAYLQAQNALKNNEEYSFSDEEIDQFLPNSLRKKSI